MGTEFNIEQSEADANFTQFVVQHNAVQQTSQHRMTSCCTSLYDLWSNRTVQNRSKKWRLGLSLQIQRLRWSFV